MWALVAGAGGGQLVALGQLGEPLPHRRAAQLVDRSLAALLDQPATVKGDRLAVDDRSPRRLALGPKVAGERPREVADSGM